MNINLLRDDPDWKWSLLVAALSCTLTMGIWIAFKIPLVSSIVFLSHMMRAEQFML
jgi:hypothetical protein